MPTVTEVIEKAMRTAMAARDRRVTASQPRLQCACSDFCPCLGGHRLRRDDGTRQTKTVEVTDKGMKLQWAACRELPQPLTALRCSYPNAN